MRMMKSKTNSDLLAALEGARRDLVGVVTNLYGGFSDRAIARGNAGIAAIDEALGRKPCAICNQVFTSDFKGQLVCRFCAAIATDAAS